MQGRTHVLFAALLGSLYFDRFGAGDWIIKIGFAIALIAGAFLPDIDERHSTISQKLPVVSSAIQAFTKHRGIFHSIWIPIAIFLAVNFFLVKYFVVPNLVLMGLIIGYVSHLASDSLTVRGVEPFHPLHNFKVRGFITTGGFLEMIVVLLILTYFIVK